MSAQSTTVSGTVTDAGAQAWAGGSYQFQFVPNPQFPVGPYTWTGGALTNVISGTLDGSGHYSQSVPSNSAISPVGSKWILQVTPNASWSSFSTAPAAITGGTQTLNVTPPVIAIGLASSPLGSFTRAYSDLEIVTKPVGGQYYNVTLNVIRVWNGSVWLNAGNTGSNSINLLAAGAVCDGTTDDTVAIAAAYASVAHTIGAQINWPSDQSCVMSNSVTLYDTQSTVIQGGSVIWKGNSSNPVFIYSTDKESRTKDFFIVSNPTFPIGTGFVIREDITTPVQHVSSGLIFENNVFEGGSAGGLATCFQQAVGTFTPATNDEVQYNRNECRNYSNAGFEMDDSQATDDTFIGNRCYGAPPIASQCVLDTVGAGFNWRGGFVNANTYDFNVASQTAHPITIDSVASEGSKGFVQMAGPTGAPSPLNLINDRFSTNNLQANGRCVNYQAPGPLNIIGGSYGQANTPCTFFFAPNTGSITTIWGSIIGVNLSGANSRGTQALAFFPSTLTVNVAMLNNVYRDNSGVASTPTVPEVNSVSGINQVAPFVFSKLPSCGATTEGQTASVTDSTTNTWGATITGGSTNHVSAYCDGTNWTVAGK